MTFGLRCSGPARRPHPASLPVRVPTVEGLPLASFSFASRLRLAVRLRLPSSAPVGSFHPTRFCPCWAHPAAGYQAAPGHVLRSRTPANSGRRTRLATPYMKALLASSTLSCVLRPPSGTLHRSVSVGSSLGLRTSSADQREALAAPLITARFCFIGNGFDLESAPIHRGFYSAETVCSLRQASSVLYCLLSRCWLFGEAISACSFVTSIHAPW